MTGTALDGLTRTQLEDALLWLRAYDGDMFADALSYARSRAPQGHGENHVDNAGHVIGATVPGECITCHGHAEPDGTWIPAVAS